MPVATVHRQITAQDRITYGTEENIRGRILDVGTQKWPAGSALVGIFSADGTQTAAAGNHPLPEVRFPFSFPFSFLFSFSRAFDGKKRADASPRSTNTFSRVN
jgi:hypothetical protein